MTLDPDLLARAVAHMRELEPDAVAVVVTGSYAKDTADERSDLDLRALTTEPPRVPYRTWFVDRPGTSPLHVSAGTKTVEDWLADGLGPAAWALGFPARDEATYAWSTPEAVQALGDPPTRLHPASPPELEDFVEALVKVRRAEAAGDAVGARWHARSAAELAPRLLVSLNPERVVHDRRDALDAALSASVAPPGYPDALAACLGVREASNEAVAAAATELGRGLLELLRERAPDVDAQPGIGAALADGTLARQLDG